MAYEIPKNLKYSEKILFNLTTWQSLWLGLFSVLALIVFTKTTLFFEAKIFLIILFFGLGAGFAFFELKKHLWTAVSFLSQPRQLGYLDKKMQKFIEIKSIKENSFVLNNGSIKAVLQVQPINFHILSTRQQQAIISAYKDFLNSLDYPIQIIMRTVNLSLDEYLKHLEFKVKKTKNEKLKTQFNEFQEFVKGYIEEHAVKNRLFYIVIPAEEKNSNAINQLDIRVKLCQEKLKSCNLSTKRLSDQELLTMFSSYFEGFIETGNEYQTMATLLEKRGENIG